MEEFNQYVFRLIYGFSRRNFFLDGLGIFLAQYLPYILVLGFLVLIWKKRDWRMKMLVFADGALAVLLSRGIVTELIRFFYHHARPFVALNFAPLISESSYSFPSGHAVWFFSLAVVVFYHNRKLGIWYFVFAAANGLARVFVGVHWPLDIVGGAIVGVLCGTLAHGLLLPSLKEISGKEKVLPGNPAS